MERHTILNQLKSILLKIKPSIDCEAVSEETLLIEDLGLDSLTIMLLSLSIENKFGIRFKGNPDFATIGQVIDYIVLQTS